MAAFGFKTLAWIGCVGVAAPGFYLVISQVASERARVESVDRAIVRALADIRQLETEVDTRANMAQLERWNGDVLALGAPRAEQFVGDAARLASLPSMGLASTDLAMVVPSAPVAPVLPKAAPEAVAATAVAARTPAPPAPPAPTPPPPAQRAPVRAATATAAAAPHSATRTPAERKAQAVAMLDRTLLSDTTLGDIARSARAEARSLR